MPAVEAVAPGWRRHVLPRALPFALYILALALGPLAAPLLPAGLAPWLYLAQVGPAALALAWGWRRCDELAWGRPGGLAQAVAIGLGVWVLWLALDLPPYLSLRDPADAGTPPPQVDGAADWRWLALRLAGAALVVPIMEELFWRSLVMRWIDRADFQALAPAAVSWRAVVLSSLVFAVEHAQWLAGFLAGLAYAWLYRRHGLGSAVVAHGVTNLALGAWVILTGAWVYW
jgi:hypothetical protein